MSRNGHVFKSGSQLAEEIAHSARAREVVLDGEIGCLEPDGRMPSDHSSHQKVAVPDAATARLGTIRLAPAATGGSEMRASRNVLAALMIAAAVSGACAGSDPITAPSPVGSGATAQEPSTNRPPQPPAPSPPNPPIPEHPDKCDHRKAQWAIGQGATKDLLERARLAAGAEFGRFLRIGEPVTLEYRVGRLNLGMDDQEIVRDVRCW